MSKNQRLKTPFDSQHEKESQTLLKSLLQQFYHILLIILTEIELQGVSFSDT